MFNSIRQNQPNLVRPIVEYNSDIGLDAPFKTFDTVGRVQKRDYPAYTTIATRTVYVT